MYSTCSSKSLTRNFLIQNVEVLILALGSTLVVVQEMVKRTIEDLFVVYCLLFLGIGSCVYSKDNFDVTGILLDYVE